MIIFRFAIIEKIKILLKIRIHISNLDKKKFWQKRMPLLNDSSFSFSDKSTSKPPLKAKQQVFKKDGN